MLRSNVIYSKLYTATLPLNLTLDFVTGRERVYIELLHHHVIIRSDRMYLEFYI